MEKKINFGKIAFYGNRKINDVVVDISYEDGCFAALAFVYNACHTDCIAGGQCLDRLLKHLGDNEMFLKIYGLWKRNHLNDMNAGTPEQMACIKQGEKEGKIDSSNWYDSACAYLKEHNLYEVMLDGELYRFGTKWLKREISDTDKKLIEEILQAA